MNILKENQYIMHLCIIILLCWLGWLRGLASGQVSTPFTGSANFSSLQLTCLANLAAFIIFVLRDKLWFVECLLFNWLNKLWFEEQSEQTASKRGKLTKIEGLAGKTTCGKDLRRCHVVMLSKQGPSHFIKDFLEVMSGIYEVQSIFLKWLPLQSVEVSVEKCTENQGGRCGCIVFTTVEDITKMLARRMPRTLKLLPDSRCPIPSVSCLRNGCHSCQCILPSLNCLRNGCHGFNHGLLYVDENDRLREGDPEVDSPAAVVCEILDHLESFDKVGSCICIPVRSHNEDKWTDFLITYLKADDKEFRGVVIRKGRTDASSALHQNGECDADEEYSIASLFILPYLTRILIVVVLTLWLKVDGFSSTVLATRAVQNYITKQNYVLSPQWFLRRAVVKANGNKTNACQVLYFRHPPQTVALQCLFYSEEVVIAYCILPWALAWRIAAEGDDIPWFIPHFMIPHFMIPSTGGIVMIVAGICIALVMDGIDLKLNLQIRRTTRFGRRIDRIKSVVICATMVLEILCIVAFSAIPFAFRIWIYGALQCIVLVKYGIGFVLLYMHEDLFSGDSPEDGELTWWYRSCGIYTQSSAFLLNAILAGVRTDWKLPN